VVCIVGGGVVLDPEAFLKECDSLRDAGVTVKDRLFISNRCHLILPYHRTIEAAVEQQLGDRKIGTTARGIGPAYEDKYGRRGLRVCDLLDTATFPAKLEAQVEMKNRTLQSLQSSERIDSETIRVAYESFAERLRPLVVDASAVLNGLLRKGKSVLFEGAQATLLDVDHGTFPFVTSSNACAGGVSSGLGISPKHVNAVVGITKAYTTRVGTGPFPTEVEGACGETIRKLGNEYGATTGRPRRCGWYDGPAGRYACMINAPDAIVVTKIDVLDAFPEIPFCTGYKYKGSTLTEFPAEADVLAKIEPVYEKLPGWQTSTAGIQEWKKLPAKTQSYLRFLSDYLEVPVGMVSTGPGRDETIHLPEMP
jgi:adenylosuccinate synthase